MSTINNVSSVRNPYHLQAPPAGSAGSGGDTGNAGTCRAPTGVSASISGPGQLLSDLQQLQAQDPAKFVQVVSQIASQLQAAAKQQRQANASQFLSSLANKLENAAHGAGSILQVQPHHGHHAHGTYNSQGQRVTPASASSANAAISSSDPLQQIFAGMIQEVQQAKAA